MTLNKKNTWGGVSYETPLVTTLDVLSEGVLCSSGELTINDWQRDNTDGDILNF